MARLADSPLDLRPSRIAAMWPVLVGLLIVAFMAGASLVKVDAAQDRADAAYGKADAAVGALHLIDIRLERIQTVVERLDKSR